MQMPPDLTGREGLLLFFQVQEIRPELPVILLTSQASRRHVAEAMKAGVKYFVEITGNRSDDRNGLNEEIKKAISEEGDANSDILPNRIKLVVENEFFHPIARTYHEYGFLDDQFGQATKFTQVLQQILQYLGTILICNYYTGNWRDEKLSQKLSDSLKQPLSHGHWVELIREILSKFEDKQDELFIPEFYNYYFQRGGKELIDKLVQQRNVIVKKDGFTAQKGAEFKKDMLSLLWELIPLRNYRPLCINSFTKSQNIMKFDVTLCVGFDDKLIRERAEASEALETGKVMLANMKGKEILMLHPFYVFDKCQTCGERHLFIFQKVDKNKINYTSLISTEHQYSSRENLVDYLDMQRGFLKEQLRRKLRAFCITGDSVFTCRHQLNPGHKVNNKYEVLSPIKSGGMGDVYKVQEIESEQILALKLLPYEMVRDRSILQRFHNEIAYTMKFEHPRIVKVFDHGQDKIDYYFTMECATGWYRSGGELCVDLADLSLPIDEKEVIQIAMQICEGLDYIHAQDGGTMVHRDLKASNILLFSDGTVKITDFCIAKSRESHSLTTTGMVMGTPEYMSPEQASGNREINRRSDLYSLRGRGDVTPLEAMLGLRNGLAHGAALPTDERCLQLLNHYIPILDSIMETFDFLEQYEIRILEQEDLSLFDDEATVRRLVGAQLPEPETITLSDAWRDAFEESKVAMECVLISIRATKMAQSPLFLDTWKWKTGRASKSMWTLQGR